MPIRRIRCAGGTSADWAAAPTTVLQSGEIGFNLTSGEYRIGDGATAFSELTPLNPSADLLAAAVASIAALEARVTLLEAGDPPPEVEDLLLRYACISYIYPGSSGAAQWAILAANSAAGKLSYVIGNPNNGPGYEAKYEPGGSLHTHWTNRITALDGTKTKRLWYVSTNYGDLQSTSNSAKFRGTVGANWRVTCATSDTVSFWEDGNESLGGEVGSARSMTFAAGAGPFGFKSWYSGGSGGSGTTLPGGLALSTSYYLRPTGTTPIPTYTLHTSQAGAIANTGKVDITSTGGGSGLGPFYLGFRRNLANIATVCAEMTRYVTLYGSLVDGWFFDECEVDDAAHDAWFDAIIAYRDANHPGLLLVMNGTPHSSTRANMYDVFVMENNWSAFADRATTTLTLTGNPSNGQTLTIDGKVYTFQTTLTNADGNIFIGANAAATIVNIAAAVTLGTGSGTKYAAATTLHPTCLATDGSGDTVVISSKRRGTSGNSLTVSETMSNATLSSGTLSGGDFTGAEVVPAYLDGVTVTADKAWMIAHDDVEAYDLEDIVDFCVAKNIANVYMNGSSAFGALPTDGVDGFDQDDVLAAIDVANA